jgi:hypothetical protein
MKWLEEIKTELAEYERLATALPEYGKPTYLRDVPRLVEALERALRALEAISSHEEADAQHTTDCAEADAFRECTGIAKQALASIRGEE